MVGDRAALQEAERLYDEAESIEGAGGAEVALPLYLDIVRRLDGAEWPPSLAEEAQVLLVYAQHDIARVHDECGRGRDAHQTRLRMVDSHLDSAPTDAAEPIVDAAFHVAGAHEKAGSPELALEVIERAIKRYGHPDTPGYLRTVGLGHTYAAWLLDDLGQPARAYARYAQAVTALRGTEDPELRFALADAMAAQGRLAFDNGRPREFYDLSRELVATFNPAESSEIAERVRVARDWLDKLKLRHRLLLALPRWPR